MSYRVPFVDLPLHYQRLEEELMPVIKDVLFIRSDLIMRGDLREFENSVADFVGVKHAIGLNSGTDAIFMSLLAAGVGKGDEVITVAHTFVATVASIVFAGATPVLIDIGSDHNMNTELLEDAVTERTKVIIPVALNGRLCNMDKIMEVADRHDLIIIEDSCQAWGAQYDGQAAGSFGLTGCFSLYPMKVLGGAGDGGMLVTNDDGMAEKIRLMRDHSQDRTTGEILGYGYNSRLDNFHAAVLNVKLRHLPGWIQRRREVASLYHDGLKDVEEISLIPGPEEDGNYYDVFQNYVIRSPRRDELVAYLREKGIETLISWPKPIHHHKALNLAHFTLPETEKLSREVVSLPMNTEVTDEQIGYVIEAVKDFHSKQGVLLGNDSGSSEQQRL